jgi:hypothetical protein
MNAAHDDLDPGGEPLLDITELEDFTTIMTAAGAYASMLGRARGTGTQRALYERERAAVLEALGRMAERHGIAKLLAPYLEEAS